MAHFFLSLKIRNPDTGPTFFKQLLISSSETSRDIKVRLDLKNNKANLKCNSKEFLPECKLEMKTVLIGGKNAEVVHFETVASLLRICLLPTSKAALTPSRVWKLQKKKTYMSL